MSDQLDQILLVAGGAAIVVGAALATRRWQRPTHDRVDVHGLGLPSGIVIFTSTECAKCKEALAVVRRTSAPVREVTWELEPKIIERAGVTAVPLTVVVDESGSVVDQVVGIPRMGRLRRAIAKLGSASA